MKTYEHEEHGTKILINLEPITRVIFEPDSDGVTVRFDNENFAVLSCESTEQAVELYQNLRGAMG